MKKKIKALFSLSAAMVFLLLLPVMANAESVPWTTEVYTAGVSSMGVNRDIQYGPPLPISASFSYSPTGGIENTGSSTISSTYMDVDAFSFNADYRVSAEAKLLGTYIAPAADPFFQFTYDGYYTSVDPGYISEHYAWLTITDLSTSTVLYDNSSLTLDNNTYTIEVPTIAGNEIEVNFGAKVYASRFIYSQTENVRLNYSTAVAPEPISSILFVTGGTLLAGRRFLRRKA
jgi:hypothetical protein